MVATQENVIPPITDPMGRNWGQPDSSLITLDKTHALMSMATFNRLAEYSASNPSGVYVGKMWKRHDGEPLTVNLFAEAESRSGCSVGTENPRLALAIAPNHHRLILLADDSEDAPK